MDAIGDATIQGAVDDCPGVAAQAAFHLFLSICSTLPLLVALARLSDKAAMFASLATLSPAFGVLRDPHVLAPPTAGVLVLGTGSAMFGGSKAMATVTRLLNDAFNLRERRAWWRRGLVAMALLGVLGLTASLLFVTAGMSAAAAAWVAGRLGLGRAAAVGLRMAGWPVEILAPAVGASVVLRFAPNRTGGWTLVTPGSLLAAGIWSVTSVVVAWYLGRATGVYGVVGGVLVALGWLYMFSLGLLAGGELDGVLYRSRNVTLNAQHAARACLPHIVRRGEGTGGRRLTFPVGE